MSIEENELDGKIAMIDELMSNLEGRRKELVEAREELKERSFAGIKIRNASKTFREAEAILGSLQWKKFGPGKEGEWAFATGHDRQLAKELEPVRDVIENLKEGQLILIGEYRYKASADGKFLNRFSVTS